MAFVAIVNQYKEMGLSSNVLSRLPKQLHNPQTALSESVKPQNQHGIKSASEVNNFQVTTLSRFRTSLILARRKILKPSISLL